MFFIILLIIACVSMFTLGILNGIYENRHGKTLPKKKSRGLLGLFIIGAIIDGIIEGTKKK